MSQLQLVLYRSRKILEESSETTSTSTPRKEQRLTWNVPAEVEFGTLLDALPPVTVVEGNQDDAPIYTPPLNQRRLGFGDHTLVVTVKGNGEYNEAKLAMPLHVKRAKLKVKAPRLTVEVGKPVPPLDCTITGSAVAPDVINVTLPNRVPMQPPINMSGYPLMPLVQVSSGVAENYEITVKPGWVKVRPTDAEMERSIGEFRHRTLKLKEDVQKELFEILDKIEKKRAKTKQDELAELLQQLEMDLVDGEYVKVTELKITPAEGGTINAEEPLPLTATVEPEEATQPGIRWSVDDPKLATISEGGILTRVGKAGGPVVVTATSLCKDAIIASVTVEIKPRPQAIRFVNAPTNVFLDSTVQLTAVIEPPEADQALTWKCTSRTGKNVTTRPDGTVTIEAPSQRGGSKSGSLTMQAISTADPSLVESLPFKFGGYGAKSVELKAVPGRLVNVGDTVTLTAGVYPYEAAQDVEWSLDDPTAADVTVDGLTMTLRPKAGGPVKVICKATDGSGVAREMTVTAKVAATGFSTLCPKTAIDIIETLQFAPVFQPIEAVARVEWKAVPEDIAAIDGSGKLSPLKSGTVTVTGTLIGTEFSDAKTITITASPASAIGIDQWDLLLPRIDAFADRLLITQHHLTRAEFKTWKENLRNEMQNSKTTKTLGQMKTELLNLRNTHYIYSHSNWLLKAGFARGGNCFIRNDSRMAFNTHSFSVHMTMFPTAGQFPIGTSLDTLTESVYREGDGGFVSMHATLYVSPTDKNEQVKVYASGEDYTTKYTYVQKWSNMGIDYVQLKQALEVWMENIQGQATTALRTVFDQVHANDNSNIA